MFKTYLKQYFNKLGKTIYNCIKQTSLKSIRQNNEPLILKQLR